MKLHHIGVAVADLDRGIAHYESLGLRLAHRERVDARQVEVAFMGERPWIELVAGTGPGSAVSEFIDKRGPGQHHLAFAVPDIAAELRRQKAAGAELIDAAARPGAWGHRVAFLHPKDQGGVLIELVEEGR
ncbi:MAG: methylmalonyl-CoA epimerase [Elusimicrobia bacterium]|nr:methylmalonyl-CoA epimerase [Elusimicrobiota bacterium]